jgi:hypothetical protein
LFISMRSGASVSQLFAESAVPRGARTVRGSAAMARFIIADRCVTVSPMKLVPTGRTLGATVEGLDLAQPLAAADLEEVMQALGRYSVLRFPGQTAERPPVARLQRATR